MFLYENSHRLVSTHLVSLNELFFWNFFEILMFSQPCRFQCNFIQRFFWQYFFCLLIYSLQKPYNRSQQLICSKSHRQLPQLWASRASKGLHIVSFDSTIDIAWIKIHTRYVINKMVTSPYWVQRVWSRKRFSMVMLSILDATYLSIKASNWLL